MAGKVSADNDYFVAVTADEYASLATQGAELVDQDGETSSLFFREPQTVHFIRAGGRGGGGWRALREQLVASNSDRIVIGSAELNSWLSNSFRRVESEGGGPLALKPATPVINVTEGELHLYLPITVEYFGREFSSAIIARGSLEAGPDGLNFRPRHTYLGSSPLGGPITAILGKTISQPFRESEEMVELSDALRQFTRTELALNQIVLER